jgi:hypothetical protein
MGGQGKLEGDLNEMKTPVILPPERWSMWLGEEEAEGEGLKSLNWTPFAGPRGVGFKV